MFFYSKLEVLGGEISPCFVPKKIAFCTKFYYEKKTPNSPYSKREKKS
jgi:hypothetical protein